MTKTLLLISESFPPVDNIAAQRFPPMLRVLEEHGWNVWVVTQHGTGRLPVPLPEHRILRIGRHHQEGPTIRRGSRFARRSPLHAALRGVIQAPGTRFRIVNSTLLTWYRDVLHDLPSWQRRLSAPPDVVLGTYGPPAALWLARRLAMHFGAPWIADFRDLGALMDDGRPRWVMHLDHWIEAQLLRSTTAITTCGRHWATQLNAAYGRPAHVLYNGFDQGLLAARAGDAPPGFPKEPVLFYAGRFYERQMSALQRLLEALRGTPFRIVLRSLGPPAQETEIQAQAAATGTSGQLEIRPPVPLTQVMAEAERAAATLVLEAVSTARDWTRGHLSGKFLQLLPLGPPILYIARSDTEAGDILRCTGKGALCTTVDDIRGFLARLQSGAPWPVDAAAVKTFAKQRQGEQLLRLLETVQPAPPAPQRSRLRTMKTLLRA